MSNWYSRQFGDTGEFAISISFGGGKSHTWGGLALWVKGRCLTDAVDTGGTFSQTIQWDISDVLVWFRSAAVRLANEEPLPTLGALSSIQDDFRVRDACEWVDLTETAPATLSDENEDDWFLKRSEWRNHHSLRRAAHDVALPNVYFRRLGDRVEVSWDNETWAAPRPDLRFVERRGTEFISASTFAEVLRDVLSDMAVVLRERDSVLSTNLTEPPIDPSDWRWLVHASTAAAIRRDLPDLAAQLDQHALQSRNGIYVPHSKETLVLRQAQLVDRADIDALLEVVRRTPDRAVSSTIRRLTHRSTPSSVQPWKEGYERALEVREVLNWGNKPMPEPKAWLMEQHVEVDERRLPSAITLLSVVTPDERATIATNPRASARRHREVAYGTALAHLLLDVDPIAVDGQWEHWPSAARARAFAVMLQVPSTGVRSLLPGGQVKDVEDVRRIMDHFNSGPAATTHHLRNLRFIPTDERRDDILRELLAS